MPQLSERQAAPLIINYLNANLPSGNVESNNNYPNTMGSRNPNTPWIDVSLRWARAVAVNAGSPTLFRIPGFLLLDIKIPKGSGDEVIYDYIDHLKDLFVNNDDFRSLGFVQQGTEIDSDVGGEDSQYYTERLTIFFYIERQ